MAATFSESAVTDSDFFNIAFIHSLAAAAAKDDASLESAERQRAIAAYTDLAVAALRAMHATGMVPDDVFLNLLENNEYLDAVRGEAAFTELTAEFQDQ